MAHCEDYIELISASLDGALSPEEQERLTTHLASCAECQKLFDDLLSLHTAMAQTPPVEVPEGLKSRILDAVAAEAKNTNVLPFAPKKASRHWQRWLASAAVLAVIVMGTWSWKPWEGRADLPRSNEAAADRGMGSASFTVTGTAGAADGASPAAPAPKLSAAQPSAVPEPADPPLDAAPASESDGAPAEKLAPPESAVPIDDGTVGLSSEPPAGETVYGYAPAGQAPDASVPEDVPSVQSAPPPSGVSPQSAVMPRLFSAPIPTPAGEDILEQSVTSQAEAVNVLANYIYEFVDTVEPVADNPDVYVISSPTGVSGTVTCIGEYEPAFLLDYQESLSDQVLRYSVSRSGEVFLLEQEELSDPPMEEIAP